MIRFLTGLLVGAAIVLAIQFTYAPLPGRTTDDGSKGKSATAVSESAPGASPQSPPVRIPDADSGTPTNAHVQNMPSTERSVTATAHAETDDSRSPKNDVRNPIILPKTHEGFVSKNPHSIPEAHAELEREEVDPTWAEVVERLIATFIAGHPLGASIALVSLQCRTTRCEIVGTVYGEGGVRTWNTVLRDMQQQSWYATYFSDSRLGSGGSMPGEHRFVTILARVGIDIPPPVDP